MKKFEIIEEGRLSKSEMNQVTGGWRTCGLPLSIGSYSERNCGSLAGAAPIVTCTLAYASCAGTNKSCIVITYTGPQGPGGIMEMSPNFDLGNSTLPNDKMR